jgi:hypothetical protein
MKTGSADVYVHEIPGGQYTNLHFQVWIIFMEISTKLRNGVRDTALDCWRVGRGVP